MSNSIFPLLPPIRSCSRDPSSASKSSFVLIRLSDPCRISFVLIFAVLSITTASLVDNDQMIDDLAHLPTIVLPSTLCPRAPILLVIQSVLIPLSVTPGPRSLSPFMNETVGLISFLLTI